MAKRKEIMAERQKQGFHCYDCDCKLGKCDCICCDLNPLCISYREILQ